MKHPSPQFLPGREYEATIDHYPSIEGSKLTFYCATKPLEINIEKVPSAVLDRYPNYPDHSRLEAVYETNINGQLNVVTILLPHGPTDVKPFIQRIDESGFSGAKITHGTNATDVIIESSGEQEQSYESISFVGKSMISRYQDQNNSFYFIRKGTFFNQNGFGFQSENPVSIFVVGHNGVIISNGTPLTLNGPGADRISFNTNVTILDSGEQFIKVEIPAGEVRF